MKIAALIHLLDWCSEDEEYTLLPGLRILNLEPSPINDLYIKTCLNTGLDEGEPYNYQTAIELDFDILGFVGDDFFDPYSLGVRVINLLTIYYGTPLGMVRTIYSDDNYKTLKFTQQHFDYTAQIDLLIEYHNCFSNSCAETISTILKNTLSVWNKELANSRIINALTYFFYSWNIHYLEQTAINISIALECLFSPSGNSELTHQIALNIANFKSYKKEETYKQFKKFYTVRSKIVHGERLKEKDYDLIPSAFQETSRLLLQIVLDKELTETFNNNDLRRKYFNNLLF